MTPVMLGLKTLQGRSEGSVYSLSARRLWDHSDCDQNNVFEESIRSEPVLCDPEKFVDVARMYGTGLLVYTVYEWRRG